MYEQMKTILSSDSRQNTRTHSHQSTHDLFATCMDENTCSGCSECLACVMMIRRYATEGTIWNGAIYSRSIPSVTLNSEICIFDKWKLILICGSNLQWIFVFFFCIPFMIMKSEWFPNDFDVLFADIKNFHFHA